MTNALPVLFTHFGDEWIRGSEIVLLDLWGAQGKNKIHPLVWCNGAGWLHCRDEKHDGRSRCVAWSVHAQNLSVRKQGRSAMHRRSGNIESQDFRIRDRARLHVGPGHDGFDCAAPNSRSIPLQCSSTFSGNVT